MKSNPHELRTKAKEALDAMYKHHGCNSMLKEELDAIKKYLNNSVANEYFNNVVDNLHADVNALEDRCKTASFAIGNLVNCRNCPFYDKEAGPKSCDMTKDECACHWYAHLIKAKCEDYNSCAECPLYKYCAESGTLEI